MTLRMDIMWRAVFALGALGAIAAAGYGSLGLIGFEVEGETVEFVVALAFGVLILPFCASAALAGRFTLTENEAIHAPLGPWLPSTRVDLADVERWSVAEEKGGGGGTHTVLLWGMIDGSTVGMKIEMYAGHHRVAGEIERLTGKAPSSTKVSIAGAKFDDDHPAEK